MLTGGVAAGCASTPKLASLPPQTLVDPRANDEAAAADTVAVEPLAVPGDNGAAATSAIADGAPPTTASAPSTAPAAPAEPPAGQPAARGAAKTDTSVIRFGPRDDAGQKDTITLLREASQAERDRRRDAGPSVLVLTDDNLAEKAAGGGLTFASGPSATSGNQAGSKAVADGEPGPADAGGVARGASKADPLGDLTAREEYWRSRTLAIRQKWRQAYDEAPRLQEEVDRLRTSFYAEDDPVRRDREIKPLWDRALDRLRDNEQAVESAQDELEVVVAEGVREGALPGWLREGIELEPPTSTASDDENPSLEELDPGEPIVAGPAKEPPP